jgi:beta-lactamase superfamily II metal-dependent hydrolase
MKKFLQLIFFLFLFVGCGRDVGELEVYVFGLANADAVLITTENHVVMIDTGENQHGRYIAERLTEKEISHIDYLIITHFDRDHVGGAHRIINSVEVRNVIVPNYQKISRSVERFEEAMNEANIVPSVLAEIISFTLDDAEFTVYPSQLDFIVFGNDDDDDDEESTAPRENNFSVAVTVQHGENNFIFTGDAMSGRLRELLLTEAITSVDFDFLKIPHHGRHNRRSVEFINAVSPAYAVSTCCEARPTDNRIIAALEAVGAEIFFSKHGGVLARSDGYNLIVKQG